jgi:hypothetical protein
MTPLKVLCFLLCAWAVFGASPAQGHWDMEARFWGDNSGETFTFRIHNGSHANRSPVRKELNICFWLEQSTAATTYASITEKKCSMVVLKPEEWMEVSFNRSDLAIQQQAKANGKLKKGSYRAVVVAKEQKGRLEKILFGAALEKLYSYFEVK